MTKSAETMLRAGRGLENPKLFTRTALLLAILLLGCMIGSMPPLEGMTSKANLFLATLLVAVVLWMLDLVEDYIVGFMLLISWVVFDIAPTKIALAGFSDDSWLFAFGALAIATAVGQTALLQRLSRHLINLIPLSWQKTYLLCLLGAGVPTSLLLPNAKARAAVATPIGQAISHAASFEARSNGSAALALAAFNGFSQMSFVFLTGSPANLIAWNFLPPAFKAEFSWVAWLLAVLPATVCISLGMACAIWILLPLSSKEKDSLKTNNYQPSKDIAPLNRRERVTLVTLLLTVVGWMTTSLHGVNECWIAVGALVIFLLTGVLDNKSFKTEIDWGLVMFFGVVTSIPVVAEHTKVNVWFTDLSGKILSPFAGQPLVFLLAVCLLVSVIRLFLRKTPTSAVIGVAILPLSSIAGIHPGVVLVTGLMAGECLLFAYQDGSYQVAYAAAGGNAFSHHQARKILAVKYLATLLAIVVSVPYWRFLGFIN